MTLEEIAAEKAEALKAVKAAAEKAALDKMPEMLKSGLTSSEVKEQLKTIVEDALKTAKVKDPVDDAEKTVSEIVEEMQKQHDDLAKMVNKAKDDKPKTLLDELKAESENIKKALAKKGGEYEFVIKAPVYRASVADNGMALDVPGIGQLAHRKLTIYDIFAKIPVPRNANGTIRYVDWDDATKVRAAAAIAEGGTFPESTAAWQTYTLTIKKIGDSIPMSEEFEYDDAMFAAELSNFLNTNVAIKIDTDLVNGDGTGNNALGVLAQVPVYTPAASGIQDASIYDLFVKVKESISTNYGSKYSPNVAMMNISDINKYKLKKDANNNYVMPPFVSENGQVIDGITVLECNALAADTMVLGDSRYGKIYEEPGFYVATGYNGTDWAEDMKTMKARKRLNLLIRTVDQTGWKKVVGIAAALVTLGT